MRQTRARDTRNPILATKLNPPNVRPDIVARPRLLERLEREERRPLTVISGPAGYGKSTLAAQWLEMSARPGVWLSLDEGDDDPRSLLGHLVAAIRRHSPRACRGTHDLLGAGDLPEPAFLAGILANEIERIRRPFILALDDYHRISNPDVHDILNRILEHPPRCMHLAILGRRDPPVPLVALKARGLAVEIRERDLRFSAEETRAVLERVGALHLDGAALDRVMAEMEGWVAGLRLLCLACGDRGDPDASLPVLSGDVAHVQEYLVEQVLERQPPEIQECLLRTSILDRFCAPLCEALCEGAPGDERKGGRPTGDRFMRTVSEANLFAVGLDASGEWIRYHHLFRQLLRDRLDSKRDDEEIAALHRRAAAWFAGEGLVEEGLEHALAAGDQEGSARIVEDARFAALNDDEWPRLVNWLDRLPPGLERERPHLSMCRAYILMQSIRMAEIPPVLERVAGLVKGLPPDPVLDGERAFFRGIIEFFTGDPESAQASFAETLRVAPVWHRACRADAEYFLGVCLHLLGQKPEALRWLNEAIARTDKKDGFTLLRLTFGACFVRMLAAEWPEALQAAARALDVSESHDLAYGVAWAEYMQANAALQMLDLDLARERFDRAVKKRFIKNRRAAVDALVGSALTRQLLGQAGDADEILREAADFAHWSGDSGNLDIVASGRARVSLLRGDLAAASRWRTSASPSPGTPVRIFFLEHPEITECRALVAERSGESLREADGKLARIESESAALNHRCQLVPVRVLRALLLRESNREDEALEVLAEAVGMAGPGSFWLPFVEAGPRVADLLRKLPRHRLWGDGVDGILRRLDGDASRTTGRSGEATPERRLIESLTNRELDVIEALAERLYDKEIAVRLGVSVHTVKSHLKNIYGKLHAANRRQAVARAGELGLLS